MSDKLDNEVLTQRLVSIVEQAREHVSRSVNTAMVHTYWLMGVDRGVGARIGGR